MKAKITVTDTITLDNYDLGYREVSLEEFLAALETQVQALIAKGASREAIRLDFDCDSETGNLTLHFDRAETDAELKEREDRTARFKKYEYAQYLKLKSQFEPEASK